MPSPENQGPVTIRERFEELRQLSKEESPAYDHVRAKIERALRIPRDYRLDQGN